MGTKLGGKKLGMDCKLYYSDSALTDANGPSAFDWTEITRTRDATLRMTKGEADVTDRGNSGERATLSTLRDRRIEFTMFADSDQAAYTALLSAYNNNTRIALAAMDGDIASVGSEGFAANFNIQDLSRNENLTEGVAWDVVATPYDQHEWYEVSGS